MFTAYLLHILSSSLELGRRGRLARKAYAVVLLSFAFFPSGSGGGDRQTTIKILGNFSPFPQQFYLKLVCKSYESFECFQIAPLDTESVTSKPCLHTLI